MFWFIVLLFVLGGGFYCYSRLKTLEKEIRAEQDAEKMARDAKGRESSGNQDAPDSEKSVLQTDAQGSAEQPESLELRLQDLVKRQPGIKQTELYDQLEGIGKRQLQQQLKQMTDAGQLKREKQGSSYLLFPS